MAKLTPFQLSCRKVLAEPYAGSDPALHRLQQESAALLVESQRREQFEEEVWCAHKWLDDMGIPRADVGGEVFSLVGRMTRLRDLAV